MKRIILAAIVATFAAGSAFAQDASCDAKAVGKDGKPLAGAAKTSFMKKCNHDACETKAVGSDGKKLAGAAKTSIARCVSSRAGDQARQRDRRADLARQRNSRVRVGGHTR